MDSRRSTITEIIRYKMDIINVKSGIIGNFALHCSRSTNQFPAPDPLICWVTVIDRV